MKQELPTCPVEITMRLIDDKWKILIIRDLLIGTKRFGELRKSLTGISQKVLTNNLRDMEKSGLVHREVFAEVPPRVEYSLFFYFSLYISFITLQGFPTATLFDGISLFTILPAPITTLSPIVTPGSTTTFPPIHTLFPTLIGFAYSNPLFLVS